MKFSNLDSTMRASWRVDKGGKQITEDRAQVVAPVEPELDLGQVAVGELDRVVRAGERGLHVADEGVDGLELVVEDAGLAAAGDLTVVDRASAGGDLEAVQAIGHQRQRQRRMPAEELLHGLVREGPRRQAGQVGQAVLGGLHRGHEGHLVLRAPASLAAATLATEVGVVDLHPTVELAVGLGQPHALQDLALDQPSGAVAHAQVPPELQGRDVGLGLGQQLHRQEPARQGQLAGLEDHAAKDAALVLAASALPVASAVPLEAGPGLADAAARALETSGPAPGDQRRLALLVGAIQAQELPHRQPRLELHSVHRQGASPWWMRPSPVLTGSPREPAELRR